MSTRDARSAGERFLLATLEEGEPWDRAHAAIYEGIRRGLFDCDETGRVIQITGAGDQYVENMRRG